MALTALEEAVLATPPMPDGTRPVTEPPSSRPWARPATPTIARVRTITT